jgi:type III secretory pathway component EscV
MLRNSLQKMMNEMMKDGMGNTGEMRNMLNKMEQTETDIVNKQISQETLRRQQDILTRLLEAEKAERERDLDDKRESNENKNEQKRNISAFEQYKKTMQQEEELLRTISPELRPYYRNMVKDYFGTFN